jgi:hypothetical protein
VEETDYGKNCRRRHEIHKGTERVGERVSSLVKSSNMWRRNARVLSVSINPIFLEVLKYLFFVCCFTNCWFRIRALKETDVTHWSIN